MNDENVFLRAIEQDRDNPVPRLVYADWLEEKDDLRCEYLRLMCRMAELREDIDSKWIETVQETRFVTTIWLNSGRSVSLRSLRQFHVYEGLLEGLPTKKLNQRIINRTIEGERQQSGGNEPYLIEPEETPIEYRGERLYPFGEPASIPSVGCVGRFHSFQPARNSNEDYSELVLIWFQDHMALPFGKDVLPKILTIDWEKHAHDYIW